MCLSKKDPKSKSWRSDFEIKNYFKNETFLYYEMKNLHLKATLDCFKHIIEILAMTMCLLTGRKIGYFRVICIKICTPVVIFAVVMKVISQY